MPEPCLVDNDVVLKIAAFGLNGAALCCLMSERELPAMLGVGRFVVRRKAAKASRFKQLERIAADLEALLGNLQVIEPTEAEIDLAADLEDKARQLGGGFDVGEAQLFAVLLTRGSPALVTGDKRAIVAASALDITDAEGRIVCLEQLFGCIAQAVPTGVLRQQVCAEPQADRALSSCFACASADSTDLDLHTLLEALGSYVAHLRGQSGALLMDGRDISALSA